MSLEVPPASPVYLRYGDDFLVLGVGGWKRALQVAEELERQSAGIGLSLSPKKDNVGAVTDSFDMLGINWRVSRDDHTQVLLRPTADRMSNACNEIDKTIRRNLPRGPFATIDAVRKVLVRRTAYLRTAGADFSDIGHHAAATLRDLFLGPPWVQDRVRHIVGRGARGIQRRRRLQDALAC
jgi:hypothetical protein